MAKPAPSVRGQDGFRVFLGTDDVPAKTTSLILHLLHALGGGLARVPGPHGIPLIAHAKAGGPAAVPVFDYVSTVLAQLENRK